MELDTSIFPWETDIYILNIISKLMISLRPAYRFQKIISYKLWNSWILKSYSNLMKGYILYKDKVKCIKSKLSFQFLNTLCFLIRHHLLILDQTVLQLDLNCTWDWYESAYLWRINPKIYLFSGVLISKHFFKKNLENNIYIL